eukprot:1677111-Karenia_brevis.AAC.1
MPEDMLRSRIAGSTDLWGNNDTWVQWLDVLKQRDASQSDFSKEKARVTAKVKMWKGILSMKKSRTGSTKKRTVYTTTTGRRASQNKKTK